MIFPDGKDGIGKGQGRDYADLRWSRFKHFAPADMYAVVGEHVFPSCERSAAMTPPTRIT